MDIREVLASRLRTLRGRLGLTQDELARGAGHMTRAYVSELEAGKRLASIETVSRLARALGVEPGELLKGGPVANPKRAPTRKETSAERLGRKIVKLAEGAGERKVKAFEIVAKAYFGS